MMTKQAIHANLCDGLKELYRTKNSDYGNSYTKVREIMPNSILVRLHDKLNRVTTLMLNKEAGQEVKDESIEDTLRDLANYALMELMEREFEKQSEVVDMDLLENHLTLPVDRLMPAFANVAKYMLEETMFGKDVKEVSEMTSEEVVEYYKQLEVNNE